MYATKAQRVETRSVAPGQALVGSEWSAASRWVGRLITVSAALALARLLSPEEFGLMAVALLTVSLAQALTDPGTPETPAGLRAVTPSDIQQARNRRWGQRLLGCAVALVAAGWTDDLFRDARLPALVAALALTLPLGALVRISAERLQHEGRHDLAFLLEVLPRALGLLACVLGAWWLRNCWALVLGLWVVRTAEVVVSHRIDAKRRPERASGPADARTVAPVDVRAAGAAHVLRHVLQVLDRHAATAFIAHGAGLALAGSFAVAQRLAAVPTYGVLRSLRRESEPALMHAAAQADVQQQRALLLSLGVQLTMVLPLGAALSLTADDLVPLLLGPQWAAMVPLVQALVLVNCVAAMFVPLRHWLHIAGRTQDLALALAAQVLCFLSALPWVQAGPEGLEVVGLRLAAALAGGAATLLLVRRLLPAMRTADFAQAVYRPLLAAGLIIVLVQGAATWLGLDDGAAIAFKLLAAGLGYPLLQWVLWHGAGRPAGPEQYLSRRWGDGG